MAKENKFCYCCQEEKSVKDFSKHGDGRFKEFCKECYDNFTHAERKSRQVKYVFDIIKDI